MNEDFISSSSAIGILDSSFAMGFSVGEAGGLRRRCYSPGGAGAQCWLAPTDRCWHDPIMAAKPVQISLDAELLKRIDGDKETKRKGRSAFIRSAIERYLREKEQREIDDQIRRALTPEVAAEMQAEIDEM